MSQRIIAFVGMMGSGKGTCGDYLSDKYGYPVYHFGNMVYEEVERRGLDNVNDETYVRADMRAKEGAAVMAKHIVRKIEHDKPNTDVVILDGLYTWSEYQFLEEVYDNQLSVVAIVADKKTRRTRILQRNDNHRSYNLPQIIAREIDEIENMQKGAPIAYADYYAINNGDLGDLTNQIETIHGTILGAK